MDGVLTAEQCNVKQGMDLVELNLGGQPILLYYQDVLDICMKIRGLATFALRYERNPPALIHELDNYEKMPLETPLSPVYRRSGLMTNVKGWKVTFEGQLVVIRFNEQIFKFHYVDAVILNHWLGRAAKEAKHWAGDTSRTWRIFARLTDAEDNDKFAFG